MSNPSSVPGATAFSGAVPSRSGHSEKGAAPEPRPASVFSPDPMFYRNLSGYFRETYREKVAKLCLDGGFTCPNRDGRCGVGGCIFCGERGAGEHIRGRVCLSAQVAAGIAERPKAKYFIAYFQNFTNTYAPLPVLKQKYDEALAEPRVRILAIGTRPDCIDEGVAALLASYLDRCEVWVELGLQTANDRTAAFFNRGYPSSAYGKAATLLSEYGLKVIPHLMVGLPGEGMTELGQTVDFINAFPYFGIKIHALYVMEGTRLASLYRAGQFHPQTEEDYINSVLFVLTHIPPDKVVHRLTGDCPKDRLLAPLWSADKDALRDKIVAALAARGERQGCAFSPTGR